MSEVSLKAVFGRTMLTSAGQRTVMHQQGVGATAQLSERTLQILPYTTHYLQRPGDAAHCLPEQRSVLSNHMPGWILSWSLCLLCADAYSSSSHKEFQTQRQNLHSSRPWMKEKKIRGSQSSRRRFVFTAAAVSSSSVNMHRMRGSLAPFSDNRARSASAKTNGEPI